MHPNGLQPTPRDPRDYSYHKTFGAVLDTDIPQEFSIGKPLKIKDQGSTDLCSAFGSTEVDEDQENIEMSPEWFFSKIKQIQGNWQEYGADLRTPCKAAVKYGFLPQNLAPFTLLTQSRDFIANWENWPNTLDNLASQHKKDSFFAVTEFAADLFDSIRITLWNNRAQKESILVGSDWYSEWNAAPAGVIPKNYTFKVAQHIFKLFGWKNINGECYIMAQNSEGDIFGDHGIAYFPRDVVNKEFGKYGMYCFAPAVANPKPTGNALWAFIFNLFKSIFK